MQVYIAAPFFSDEQKSTLDRIEALFDRYGFEYFSPRREGGILNEMSPEEKEASLRKVFLSNIKGMTDSGLILAVVDSKDTGTTWEMGFFYGFYIASYFEVFQGIGQPISNNLMDLWSSDMPKAPIITFSEKGKAANVMLSQATSRHFNSLDLLEEYVKYAAYLRGQYPEFTLHTSVISYINSKGSSSSKIPTSE